MRVNKYIYIIFPTSQEPIKSNTADKALCKCNFFIIEILKH